MQNSKVDNLLSKLEKRIEEKIITCNKILDEMELNDSFMERIRKELQYYLGILYKYETDSEYVNPSLPIKDCKEKVQLLYKELYLTTIHHETI